MRRQLHFTTNIALTIGILLLVIFLSFSNLEDSRLLDFQNILQDFVTIFLGITIEALPFLVLGVLVAVGVDLFISPRWLIKVMPKNKFLSHLTVSFLGIFFPVCECGNVPVVRSLLMHGFSVSQATTFLLAAPIINPITFLATSEAFNFQAEVAVIRIGAALVISVGIGLLLSFHPNQKQLLVSDFEAQTDACEHDHEHSRLGHALSLFQTEFITTLRLLLIGAMIAAATQTLIPRAIIESIGSSAVLSVVAMLVLAFIVSICANIDAFFALAYVNTFTLGSILTFLVFGPMIDIKMLTMLRRTYSKNALIIIAALVSLLSVILGLLVNLLL